MLPAPHGRKKEGSLKAGLQLMYIHTINNHTIKYEPQSLVVGDGVAYK